ncbi:RNA polymerase sigma factor [Priestia endophytica]|uniref:RNA polymerase sigma factor n=1 Tax=Priestia endophytica TaxID=135735 RepID=A0AAX1QE43_9BACI|nr:RNA polymerase sigma factor [Priestia endophytica]MCM3538783.1 RNA polymerase sigma factor [Priestia endophytica]RAS81978.1 hypothetical protein A3864_00285 [Priestia endophytica]RAS86452.1 hypothetical protein A3863_17745 [Priestia endophytica]
MTHSTPAQLMTAWYEQYRHDLCRYVRTIVKDAYQAEDIIQETFVKAFQHIESLEAVTKPQNWLYRVAHNLAIDFLRRETTKDKTEANMKFSYFPAPSTEEVVSIREASKELVQAVNRLKPSYKSVVTMRKIQGLSLDETSALLSWPKSKVKVTLCRALKKLRSTKESQ